jgi:hypothetical protein
MTPPPTSTLPCTSLFCLYIYLFLMIFSIYC